MSCRGAHDGYASTAGARAWRRVRLALRHRTSFAMKLAAAPRGFDKIIVFGTRPDGGRNGASAYARRRHSVTQVCDVGKETV